MGCGRNTQPGCISTWVGQAEIHLEIPSVIIIDYKRESYQLNHQLKQMLSFS